MSDDPFDFRRDRPEPLTDLTDPVFKHWHHTVTLLQEAMHQGCLDPHDGLHQAGDHPGGPHEADWLDTAGISTWRDIGDYLVENADWERHPSGVGRRQFYRPPTQEEEA